MQPTNKLLSPLVLDDGTFNFFSYTPHHPSILEIKADTALRALTKLLGIEEDTDLESLLFFTARYNIPAYLVRGLDNSKANLEEVSFAFLDYLYANKMIDPHRYYRWDFMTTGLAPFLFRGRNETEIMRSFILNYRKALSPQANSHVKTRELMRDLDMAFRTLLGMNGLTLGDLLSYRFVSEVHLSELTAASQYTINTYKRAA